ncbi:MAG: deoxyribose-phosphate aldolase [Eubacteriales bacterium]|nr:deoxyribose-phosphate aldolase [Eubacteriales bacterium]MDD3199026.1 deoxyribose-phosphate aldolase [Eubacteriales bacterium]MDD4121768.1 deoxyribose-phosphate aldolase [Eubacteriales bacterium]MDD4629488.1 deoxyribose-phosphate aldolase [Eubacteriales bacterium]
MKELNRYFDHTLLKPEATEDDINKLCGEAREYGFYAVCVNSCYVPLAAELLEGSDVKVASVVGFPLGACSMDVKAFETEWVCSEGAKEIDMVIHVGALKEGRYDYVRQDIATIVAVAMEYNAIVKVILETCLLTDEEIVKACELSIEAGASFVKTSTGFSIEGATARHVALMKKTVGNNLQVKASGGIRDLAKTREMIEAGADRIGASASVEIFKESMK